MSQLTPKYMNIGYLFDGYLRPNEGVSRYVEDIAGNMESRGHDVVRIVGGVDGVSDSIIQIGKTATFGVNGNKVEVAIPVSARRAEQVLDLADPDILHLQMPHNPFASGRIAKRAGIEVPVVATFHVLPNSPTIALAMRAMAMATVRFNRSLSTMISNSSATQQFVKEVYGIDSELIPCPVDVSRFQAGKRLEKYDDEKVNIVFLGRLVERKGVQHLVRALNGLSDAQRRNIRLLIAGTGKLEESLRASVLEMGLADDTVFLGYVEEADKPDVLATADLAVFPATGGESFGIVLVEAMASRAGVVIGGNNPGYRSVLSDTPETVIDPLDTAGFSTLLKRLTEDKEERQRLHDTQQQAVKQFDVSVVGSAIEEIYLDALGS